MFHFAEKAFLWAPVPWQDWEPLPDEKLYISGLGHLVLSQGKWLFSYSFPMSFSFDCYRLSSFPSTSRASLDLFIVYYITISHCIPKTHFKDGILISKWV